MAICKFSKEYKPLFTQQGRYYDLIGGRGRGGSYSGTNYFLHLITQKDYFRGCFLRQILGDVRGSLFRDFKDRIEEAIGYGSLKLEDFDINESLMYIIYRPTGNSIISKGVTKTSGRTAKLKSLAGVTHVLIEEADELSREDFDQLDISLRTVKAKNGVKVIRIFNPPHKTHWLWDDYNLTEADAAYFAKFNMEKPREAYYRVQPKSDSGIVMIFSTYFDNVKNLDATTILKLEKYRQRDPNYYCTVVLGLVSEGMKGRVFTGWEPIPNQVFIDVDAKSMFALDFGLASPAGLIECKFVKNNMYVRQHNYIPLITKEIAILLCRLGVKSQIIIADSADPHSIAKLRRGWDREELSVTSDFITEGKVVKPIYQQMIEGFNIYPATKGPGSILEGISRLKELNIFVTEDSKDLWMEYREYKWALDKNKEPIDEPIDDFNHLIDPMRYAAKDRAKFY